MTDYSSVQIAFMLELFCPKLQAEEKFIVPKLYKAPYLLNFPDGKEVEVTFKPSCFESKAVAEFKTPEDKALFDQKLASFSKSPVRLAKFVDVDFEGFDQSNLKSLSNKFDITLIKSIDEFPEEIGEEIDRRTFTIYGFSPEKPENGQIFDDKKEIEKIFKTLELKVCMFCENTYSDVLPPEMDPCDSNPDPENICHECDPSEPPISKYESKTLTFGEL